MIAGKIRAPFHLSFKDNAGRLIGTRQYINPWTGATDYVFGGFGRNVTLTADGANPVTFNTMYGSETVNIVVPKNTLKFVINTEKEIGSAEVAMPDDVTIDIPIDYNIVPGRNTNLSAIAADSYDEAATVNGINRVFRQEKAAGYFRPRAFLDYKYANTYHIVQWEYHVTNTHGSSRMTVLEPYISVNSIGSYFTGGMCWLTD